MQNIENDMDDLFRRAAEKYPLHTGRGNWENMEKKLSSIKVEPVEKQYPAKKNNYKKLLLLFIFTFIFLVICMMIFNLNKKSYPYYQKENPIIYQSNSNSDAVANNNFDKNKLPEKFNNSIRSKPSFEKKAIKSIAIVSGKNKALGRNIQPVEEKDFSANIPSQTADGNKNEGMKYEKKGNAETAASNNNGEKRKGILLPENKNDSNENKNSLLPSGKKVKSRKKDLKEKGVYVGLIAGPDFSKVKASHFNGTGFSKGILFGYKITKSFFIETGIISDTKFYYSEGNVFKEKGASMPDGMIIKNLEGRSKILEIPIKVGYMVYNKKKTNLFIAGGVATYLMTNEKNNYNVMMNGNPEKMEGIYKKTILKIPAVFNLSAGMEHHLSGLFKKRIEPNLKLPVQGVGVGELPVTSAGIQVGLIGELK